MAQVSPSAVAEQIRERIEEAIEEATVEAAGQAGHYEISVVAAAFAGLNKLARQRMVFRALGDLLKGSDAPIHAVDRLETLTPDEAA